MNKWIGKCMVALLVASELCRGGTVLNVRAETVENENIEEELSSEDIVAEESDVEIKEEEKDKEQEDEGSTPVEGIQKEGVQEEEITETLSTDEADEEQTEVTQTESETTMEVMSVETMLMEATLVETEEEMSYEAITSCDMKDFANWRSGEYNHATGKYTEQKVRICLNDYKAVKEGDSYWIFVSDDVFHILIREMNADGKRLRSYDLASGTEYTVGKNAAYIGVSIYQSEWKSVYIEEYQNMFEEGFTAEILTKEEYDKLLQEEEDAFVEDVIENEVLGDSRFASIEACDMSDFSNWRTGHYNCTDGTYGKHWGRICLNDYQAVEAGEIYSVELTDPAFHMLIREMTEEDKMIKSSNFSTGSSFAASDDTSYIGVSLYNPTNASLSFGDYQNLFVDGFRPSLTSQRLVENTTTEVPTDNIYDFVKQMVLTGDTAEHDISSYQITYLELQEDVWTRLQQELRIELSAAYNVRLVGTFDWDTQYMETCKLTNIDADFVERGARVKASVTEFLSMVDDRMSDLEKVLLAHEYLVEHTDYLVQGTISACAGGVLGNGYGDCTGYTSALMLLLGEVNVDTYFIVSIDMNHGWLYVKIGENWYHADATWDDSQKGDGAVYQHRFLIRNDSEFESIKGVRVHYNWTTPPNKSTSTQYTNWYVHDVAGTMHYYDGMWYYKDIATNSILKSDILGKETYVVVDGSSMNGAISIVDITGNEMSYTIGTNKYSKNLDK